MKTKNKKHYKFTHKICEKVTKQPRRVAKSELKYKIMENTMRGYFSYSV